MESKLVMMKSPTSMFSVMGGARVGIDPTSVGRN